MSQKLLLFKRSKAIFLILSILSFLSNGTAQEKSLDELFREKKEAAEAIEQRNEVGAKVEAAMNGQSSTSQVETQSALTDSSVSMSTEGYNGKGRGDTYTPLMDFGYTKKTENPPFYRPKMERVEVPE